MWRMASRTPAVRQVAPVARRRTCVEWVAAGVPAVLVLGWFWLPGLVVLRVLAFRGLGLVAVAPLVTLGVLGATAILAERAGVAWGPATAVGGTAIAVGIAWLARRLDRGGRPAPPGAGVGVPPSRRRREAVWRRGCGGARGLVGEPRVRSPNATLQG